MKAWIEKPVSSPNDVEGNYFVITRNGLFDIISYSHDFGWGCSPGYFTHYLVPVEGNFLTDEEIEKIASDAWDACVKYYYGEDYKPIPDKTEYLKSIKHDT